MGSGYIRNRVLVLDGRVGGLLGGCQLRALRSCTDSSLVFSAASQVSLDRSASRRMIGPIKEAGKPSIDCSLTMCVWRKSPSSRKTWRTTAEYARPVQPISRCSDHASIEDVIRTGPWRHRKRRTGPSSLSQYAEAISGCQSPHRSTRLSQSHTLSGGANTVISRLTNIGAAWFTFMTVRARRFSSGVGSRSERSGSVLAGRR